jgi:hypothetical protein
MPPTYLSTEDGVLHFWRAGPLRSFAALRKDAGLSCGSLLQKGEVFAYVGLIQNLKDLSCVTATPVFIKSIHGQVFCGVTR